MINELFFFRADASFNAETGLAKLKIVNSKDYDAGVYKCVARVKDGRVSCEARLLLGGMYHLVTDQIVLSIILSL